MSETATQTFRGTNPIVDPVIYWRVSAFALTAVAVLGLVVNAVAGNNEGLPDFLKFDWAHNIVHVVLAAAAFLFGFAPVPARAAKVSAIVFGFVYAGLAVVGFIGGLTFELFGLMSLELGENLVHLLLGGWGLTAGFLSDS